MKKTILILGIIGVVILIGIYLFNPFKQKSSQSNPVLTQTSNPPTPSKTLKVYSDPSGFSFTYPDNLSLLNNELKDKNTYAELQLTANSMDGSLILKIADSKFKFLDEWVKLNKTELDTTKEAKLGNLKALEITSKDKIMLGALDQGVLFNIEVPINKDKDFWMEVYNQVVSEFSFTSPQQDTSQGDSSSENDVSFEGEEVVQ